MRKHEYFNIKVDDIRHCLDCIFYAWQCDQINDDELLHLENYLIDLCIDLYGSDSITGTLSELDNVFGFEDNFSNHPVNLNERS